VGSVLIFGATSTIARAISAEFAAHGYDLLLTGRDQWELQAVTSDLEIRYKVRATAYPFDALVFEAHLAELETILDDAGDSLEGAVICFGYLGDQLKAQVDFAEARRILDVNFSSCVSVLNILANHFEKRGTGFLCALSSVAGDRGRQSNYIYGAAKAGLSAYLQGLNNRLFRSDVCVLTVKPGFVDTRMTFARPGLFLVASPEAVARNIYRAVVRRKDLVYLPRFWRPIMFAIRCIPNRFFKRVQL
jgi:decaprenylphospho-beta-D-erythro-pentofuranosid-2-ulose 2-reductase